MEALIDPTTFVIGGVSLAAFAFGLVQLLKDWFGMEGKKVTALSAVIGVLVMGLYQVVQLLPLEFVPYVEAFITSIAFGLMASGYYKFATRNDQ
jgi:uncharacterized protein (DUF697 family)